jgi:hypothetical protein
MLRPKNVVKARKKLNTGDKLGYYEQLKKSEALSPIAQKEYDKLKKATITKQKTGGATKAIMKTGGMVNSNAKIVAIKKPKGRVGGTNKPVPRPAKG